METGSEAELIKLIKLLCGGVPDTAKFHPELLKVVDAVGLSRLVHLCKITWKSGAGAVGPLL